MGSLKKMTVPYKLYLQIDSLPKSLNKKLRSHRFANHKENKTWDYMMSLQCESIKPPKPLSKAHITLIRHSHRTLDYDGLVGSMKPVIDALVTCGILIDDSWNVTGPWNVQQEFRPKKEGPMLEIIIQARPEN